MIKILLKDKYTGIPLEVNALPRKDSIVKMDVSNNVSRVYHVDDLGSEEKYVVVYVTELEPEIKTINYDKIYKAHFNVSIFMITSIATLLVYIGFLGPEEYSPSSVAIFMVVFLVLLFVSVKYIVDKYLKG
ncbi:MAG TPA: hypothetical protein VKN14_05610 [Flavobacteriaceae bacterium]|nr:hypothetical protein [Flavobacteriaceae bacterium]